MNFFIFEDSCESLGEFKMIQKAVTRLLLLCH